MCGLVLYRTQLLAHFVSFVCLAHLLSTLLVLSQNITTRMVHLVGPSAIGSAVAPQTVWPVGRTVSLACLVSTEPLLHASYSL